MWEEGFPRGPGERGAGRWMDYSCVFKNNPLTLQRNVFVMEPLEGRGKRPGSELGVEPGDGSWARCSLGEEDLGCRARNLLLFVCSPCSGKQDFVYGLWEK